jgi:phage terminase small subunit
MRGRKPKPTTLRLLEGNPGKRRVDPGPAPPAGPPERPEWLDAEAKAEWDRVTAVLAQMRLLSAADRAALAAYCTAYSR